MLIERIHILNYKNIAEADLAFSPKINCLFGQNGMGKTNLLDAIYYLSFCKNHTNLPDSQLIKHGEEFCVLQGIYDGGIDIYCGIRRRQKKVFKKNKKEYERLSEHIGLIPLVMVSPDDTELIQGGSDARRKFIDQIISQFDREYLNHLIAYNKALFQRNSLLKASIPSMDDTVFEILEEQMAVSGDVIYRKRVEFIRELIPLFDEYYKTISQENEKVSLYYESSLHTENLAQLLKEKRGKDKLLGYTTVGTHKDDLLFRIDDYLMRRLGSQGQNKTYLIALKLAQFAILSGKMNEKPILLLDDIFDKLDSDRVERIIMLVSQSRFGQIFISDTNRNYLDEVLAKSGGDYRLFQVRQGEITDLI